MFLEDCDLMWNIIFFFFKQKTAYEMLRSLVGSEMCIRDRVRAYVRAGARHVVVARAACELRPWYVGGRGSRAAMCAPPCARAHLGSPTPRVGLWLSGPGLRHGRRMAADARPFGERPRHQPLSCAVPTEPSLARNAGAD